MRPSLALVLFVFEVRMWRILDWPRLNLPVPVFLKRLAAPECVFNFGMVFLTEKLLFTTVVSVAEFPWFPYKRVLPRRNTEILPFRQARGQDEGSERVGSEGVKALYSSLTVKSTTGAVLLLNLLR